MLKRRDFRRVSNCRQAKNVYIIATEGEKTEPKYLNDLKDFYRNPVIHVEVLPREESASSPAHIARVMDKFKREYELSRNDEMWIVIDKDRWSEQMLSSVAAICSQKNIHLALSNPCFEVWLLLHLRDISKYSNSTIKKLEKNKNKDLEKEIRSICGSYNKSNLDTSKYIPTVSTAIVRALNLDTNPEHRWPNSIGSRMYLLVEKIITP